VRLAAFVLSAACVVTQLGCVTRAVWEWQGDEVTVGVCTLRVKNVATLPDDDYWIVAPPDRSGSSVVRGNDGIFELRPALPLSIEPGQPQNKLVLMRAMELSEARSPYTGRAEEVVACIEPLPQRSYRVHVLESDATLHRWVRLGTVDLGPGSQSGSRRTVAIVALPFTVAADIVSLPLLLLGAAVLVAFEGVGELTGS
jgi:hypothetical protein